jgi:hypothetical protein
MNHPSHRSQALADLIESPKQRVEFPDNFIKLFALYVSHNAANYTPRAVAIWEICSFEIC